MSPYISVEEAMKNQGQRSGYRLLTDENGCTSGCCSGISIYSNTEYSPYAGAHEDQEGFYVLEGVGTARLADQEFDIKTGDSFLAAPGVVHAVKAKNADSPVKVFWFHSAV